MDTQLKNLVDTNVDSFNTYAPEQRGRMIEGLEKKISEVDRMITNVYRQADKLKYPVRNMFSANDQLVGEQKKMSAISFVQAIAPNLKAGNGISEQMLLDEIQSSINRGDKDYASGLLDAVDVVLPVDYSGKQNKKFYVTLSDMRKQYEAKIGLNMDEVRKEVEELEARKAELEFIIYAIQKGDEFVILPRVFQQMSDDVQRSGNKELYGKFVNLVEFANKSLAFLSKKKINLKV